MPIIAAKLEFLSDDDFALIHCFQVSHSGAIQVPKKYFAGKTGQCRVVFLQNGELKQKQFTLPCSKSSKVSGLNADK
jgi:hypothetical protein